MKEKELFIASLGTLLHSWGSDTPQEVFWGLNEMLIWFEEEYKVKLNLRFNDETSSEDIIEAIRNS